MSESCPFCGEQRAHYLTHICADCSCHHTEVRIPGEPHIPSYYEAEMNPDCLVHGDSGAES